MTELLSVTIARQNRDNAQAAFTKSGGRVEELALQYAERDVKNALAQQAHTRLVEEEQASSRDHVRAKAAKDKKQAIRQQFFVEHPEVSEDRFEELWPVIEAAHDRKIVTDAVAVARQSGRYRI